MTPPPAFAIDRARDALRVIDLQPDFMPGGALAVPEGDQVVGPIAALLPRFHTVVATQDWHPAGHILFAARHGCKPYGTIPLYGGEQTLWPAHCVQGSPGARLHPDFPTDGLTVLLRKGVSAHIDSYSAFCENLGPDGLRHTTGLGALLRARGITLRLDSGISADTVRRARALLTELGAPHIKIIASDGLTEQRVQQLAAAGADGFGVGENITCSPDAATGVGAVGKLVLNGYGKLTMKLARGTGKATLPGLLQAYRFADHDLLALHDEPPPPGAAPLLVPLWRGRALVAALPPLAQSRAAVQKQIAALPPHLRALEVAAPRQGAWDRAPGPWPIVVSNRLREIVLKLTADASA